MKKALKKYLAFVLTTVILAGISTAYPLELANVVKAESATPEYMAKLQGTYVDSNNDTHTHTAVSQVSSVTAQSAVYHLTCDYYVEDGGSYGYGATARVWSTDVDYSAADTEYLANDSEGHLDISFTSSDTDSWIGIEFQAQPDAVVYIWNISLKQENSNKECLSYTGFDEEEGDNNYAGTWRGWTIAGATIWSSEESDTAEAIYGQLVIPYDENLFSRINPSYMAKLDGDYVDAEGQVQSNIDIMQFITPVAGTTYVFTSRYYDRALSGGAYLLLWTNTTRPNTDGTDANGRHRVKTAASSEGVVELTYTATEDDEWMAIALEAADTSSECYMWNVKLAAENNDVNLLNNADFSKEDGTWIDWTIKDITVTDASKSEEAETAYGQKIVTGGRAMLEAMKIEDAANKTYQDPNQDFSFENLNQYKDLDCGVSENEGYMARLNGTYIDESQTSQVWKRVCQVLTGISPHTTYTLQFDYVVEESTASYDYNLLPVLWGNQQVQSTLGHGSQGTAKVTYTTGEDETWLGVGFDCQPNAIAYIRNVCVKAEGSSINLLTNGNFEEGNGSWIGWQIAGETVNNTVESEEIVAKYGHAIVPYAEELFNSDLADWSMQTTLEDSLNLTYNVALKTLPLSETIPVMRFDMWDGETVLHLGTINGIQQEDGNYSFGVTLLPQWIGNPIVATLEMETMSGVRTQTKEYSVKEYCTAILKNSRCSDEVKNLVADLLRYGAQTRTRFGKENNITNDIENLISFYGYRGTISEITDYVSSPLSGIQSDSYRWISGQLVLDGQVIIRLNFATADITNLAVKVNDEICTIVEKGDGRYCVEIPISAAEHDTTISAQFYEDNNMIGATLTYSVYTYLYRMQESASAELLVSIYRYGQSAKIYKYLTETSVNDEQEYAGGYLYFSEGNCADRMNGQTGGADKEASILRETIMNSANTIPKGSGNVYYISAKHGNNANDGLSKETAWAGLGGYAQNVSSIVAGDTVLFERGCIYRGDNIGLKSGVTYGSYGSGAKPAIYGSSDNYIGVGKWIATDYSNVWKCSNTFYRDIGCIVFNHGEAVGIKKLKNSDYVSTNISELKHNFEFYQDAETGHLYLYLEQNPSDIFYDIEICEKGNILKAEAGCNGITIDNLSIKYGGGHAIRFDSNASNITITNCEIAFMGGSIQSGTTRYGNGIEFWNGCSNVTVKDNWIYQIYDAGITHQGGMDSEEGFCQQDINVKNNLLEYCSYTLEFYVGNVATDSMKNITYEENIIRFSGYGWGMIRPDSFAVAAINAWGQQGKYVIENFKIKNNIFDVSDNALIVQYQSDPLDITYIGNTYYQKATGNIAIWTNRAVLPATDQDTMEVSVLTIETSPKLVQFIGE